MAGIDSIINNRADAFAGNPNGLMQRYAMSQDLLDLLALQKLKQDKEAAARSLQMQMQGPQGTVKDQLEGQVMDMTRNEVARAVAPGIQQQGQRMAAEQTQEAMGAGLPTQPAPALQGMAEGGIVGYAPGGPVVGYREDGTPITAEEARRIAGGERLLQEYFRKTQSERAAKNWRRVGEGIVQFLNPRPNPVGRQPDRVLTPEEAQQGVEKNVALALDEGGPRTPSRLLPIPEDALQMDSREPTRTPAAPAPTAPAREYSDAEINSGIAAMLGEDVRPMRRAAPAQAEQPKFRSRYEDRLAAIEAEKQDKMGALIDFLLAAGASGGTNLGATLTGGGAGLQARDARLKQEEADVLKSIIEDEQNQQMMGFRERELAQAAAQAAEDRALRMQLEKMGITARKEESAAEIASSEKIAAERVAMERAVQMAESSGRMNSEQAANWRARYNSASQNRETLLNAYFSGTVTGEALASLTEQLNAVNATIAQLETEVAGSTTGGTTIDPETDALLQQYGG